MLTRRSALLAVPLVLTALLLTHRQLIDLSVYRYGAGRVLDGLPLYADRDGLPFTYPPFAALVLTPLAAVPWTAAVALLSAASIAGLAVLVRRPSLAVLATACLFEPVWQTLAFGQVNLVLAALVLADLTWRPDRRWRGALVGLAAGVKLTPLFFLGYLVVTRQWLALRNAVAATAATVALAFALLPGTSCEYWTRVVSDAERIGGLAYCGNQSLMGVLVRVTGTADAARPWWLLSALVLAGLSLYVAHHLREDPLEAVSVTALGMLLASPVSWSHHWVWAVPLTIVLWRRSRPAAVAWGALFVAAPHWWVPHTDDQELHWHTWQPVAGNAYVLAAIAVLVGLAAHSQVDLRARRASDRQQSSCDPRRRTAPAGNTDVVLHLIADVRRPGRPDLGDAPAPRRREALDR